MVDPPDPADPREAGFSAAPIVNGGYGESASCDRSDLCRKLASAHVPTVVCDALCRFISLLDDQRVDRALLVSGGPKCGKTRLLKAIKACDGDSMMIAPAMMDGVDLAHVDGASMLLVDDIDVLEPEQMPTLVSSLRSVLRRPAVVVATSRGSARCLDRSFQPIMWREVILPGLTAAEIRREWPGTGDELVRLGLAATFGEFGTFACLVGAGAPVALAAQWSLPRMGVGPASAHVGYDALVEEVQLLLRAALGDSDWGEALGFRGVLLHGASGNGKSAMLARIRGALDVPFLPLEVSSSFSCWLGESERIVRETFALARRSAPCVIVIEDIDAFAAKRGAATDAASRVLATLLNELDGVGATRGVAFAATTNALDRVDSAILRPGRFDRLIEVGPPTRGDRIKMLPPGVEISPAEFADATEGYTGAETALVIRFAVVSALYSRIAVDADAIRIACRRVEARRDMVRSQLALG